MTTNNLIDDLSTETTGNKEGPGKVVIFLDEGTSVTAVGVIYGIEHRIAGKNYNATIFLDHYSKRIKILRYRGNVSQMIPKLTMLADLNKFDKIIIYASSYDWQIFLRFGYVLEAVIKHYNNGEDAFVVSKFRSQERLTSLTMMEEILMIEDIMGRKIEKRGRQDLADVNFRMAKIDDIPQLIELYQTIFETYPSPLIYPDYLKTVFGKDSIFAVAEMENKIVAAASAELDEEHMAAELTDCATNPAARGKGIINTILQMLESELTNRGYICAYTMARSKSYGMNYVYYKMNYQYQGRLVKHCDIFGSYENMNIWCKDLRKENTSSSDQN